MGYRPEYRDKSIRSFVIRAGRMTDAQKKAYEVSWPAYGLQLDDGMVDLDVLFGRSAPKILEIGFGMGDSLIQIKPSTPARRRPVLDPSGSLKTPRQKSSAPAALPVCFVRGTCLSLGCQ